MRKEVRAVLEMPDQQQYDVIEEVDVVHIAHVVLEALLHVPKKSSFW